MIFYSAPTAFGKHTTGKCIPWNEFVSHTSLFMLTQHAAVALVATAPPTTVKQTQKCLHNR